MYKTIRTSLLRANLSDILETIEKGEKYLLTKHGRPVGALIDLDLFEDLLALQSPSYLKSIKEARLEYKKGQYSSLEDVVRDLEL